MEIIYAHEHPNARKPKESIFLAGPSPRGNEDYNWRPEALHILEGFGFTGTVYVPLPRSGEWLLEYDAQADWELAYLESAGTIAFWIPRDLVHLPGFTTNVEYGLFIKSGKCILGYPMGAPKTRYLQHLAKRYSVQVCHNLECTLRAAIALLKTR